MSTPAPACRKALTDATARWPKRNRASDGIMGDARHQAKPSDHNLGNAFDLTHDPANGVDCHQLALEVIKDPRVTYVIWNKRIYNRARAAEGWRKYTGANPHTLHMHVSIRAQSRNDLSPWPWSPEAKEPTGLPARETASVVSGNAAPAPAAHNTTGAGSAPLPSARLIRKGDKGADVRMVQNALSILGYLKGKIDGIFGLQTENAVKAFQRAEKLTADGIVGNKTRAALNTRIALEG